MKVIVEFECDNAAFEDNGSSVEVSRILRKAGEKIFYNTDEEDKLQSFESNLLDANGNSVGTVRVLEEE